MPMGFLSFCRTNRRILAATHVLSFALIAVGTYRCTELRGVGPDVVDVVEAAAPPAAIGTRCTRNRDCGSGRFCSDEPGGFCTSACRTSAECGPDGLCTTRGFCWRRCATTVDCLGAGWLCAPLDRATNICVPDCRISPASTCGASSCLADGDCLSACSMLGGQSLGCSSSSTCSAAQGGRCRCSVGTDCGEGRTCSGGSCVRTE